MTEKFELKDEKILKFGHTMFLEDVVYELNYLDRGNKEKRKKLDNIRLQQNS